MQDLKNDVSNLTQLLNSPKYVNSQLLQNIEKNLKTIQDQIDKLENLQGTVKEIEGKVDKLEKLPETVKGIQDQVDKLKDLPGTVKGIQDQVGKLNDLPQETNLAKELNTIKGNIANLSTNFVNLFQQKKK